MTMNVQFGRIVYPLSVQDQQATAERLAKHLHERKGLDTETVTYKGQSFVLTSGDARAYRNIRSAQAERSQQELTGATPLGKSVWPVRLENLLKQAQVWLPNAKNNVVKKEFTVEGPKRNELMRGVLQGENVTSLARTILEENAEGEDRFQGRLL